MNQKYSEYLVHKGKKFVVHTNKCRCVKNKMDETFNAYGMKKEDIIYDIDPFDDLKIEIAFAPCAEKHLALLPWNQ